MNLRSILLDLLFPPKCPFCGKVMDTPEVCPKCRLSLPWTGESGGVRTLEGGLLCAAPLRYKGAVRQALLDFKFHGASGKAEALGGLIAQQAAEYLSGEFDTVTWAPVSRRRLRKRGYDQAELLARAACRAWDTQPKRLLEKKTDNPAQSGQKDAAARRKNVRDVYRLPCPEQVSGRRILLIDDICTTGSTLVSCAGTLRGGGAASVVCAAAAFASPEDDGEKGAK